MATLIGPDGSATVDGSSVGADVLAGVTGWELKPEGLCRDERCMLVPDDLRSAAEGRGGDGVDAAALWERLGWPVVRSGDDVYLGEGAEVRAETLAGAIAPDFTLTDLAGVEHSLSDHRGKKVLLVSWAPW